MNEQAIEAAMRRTVTENVQKPTRHKEPSALERAHQNQDRSNLVWSGVREEAPVVDRPAPEILTIDKIIAQIKTPAKPYCDHDQPPIPPAFDEWIRVTWEALVGGKRLVLTLPDEEKILGPAVIEDERLQRLLPSFYSDRDRAIRDEEKNKHEAALMAGNTNPPRVRSYDEIRADLQEGRRAINRLIEANNKKVAHIIPLIRARFLKAADELADHLQGGELERHEVTDGKWGWSYVPSQTVVVLRQLQWRGIASGGASLKACLDSMGVDTDKLIASAKGSK
jgi:hypothetical protein